MSKRKVHFYCGYGYVDCQRPSYGLTTTINKEHITCKACRKKLGLKCRYVVAYDLKDGFPLVFRDDCERTLPSLQHPDGEGLAELMERYDAAGYGIYDRPYDFQKKEWI
jgi:hypothetical protein